MGGGRELKKLKDREMSQLASCRTKITTETTQWRSYPRNSVVGLTFPGITSERTARVGVRRNSCCAASFGVEEPNVLGY